jgi:hypothetical protein
MRIYISSSWKNRERVRAVAEMLEAAGHSVYDFTNPKHRVTPDVPPERYPDQFDPEKHDYAEYLRTNPEWKMAVMGNMASLRRCDVCVLLLPCGLDAHADWAFAVGRGKFSAIVGHPPKDERVPTHLWADEFLKTDADILPWLESVAAEIEEEV